MCAEAVICSGHSDVSHRFILHQEQLDAEHIAAYGEGNELRLTGKFETADMDTFSFGIANRGASVHVGRDTEADGCGYFEDRRPSSNADPYVVTGKIMETIMGPEAEVIEPLNKEKA